jgi:hypothetical protein
MISLIEPSTGLAAPAILAGVNVLVSVNVSDAVLLVKNVPVPEALIKEYKARVLADNVVFKAGLETVPPPALKKPKVELCKVKASENPA